jgi:hypothetical protein
MNKMLYFFTICFLICGLLSIKCSKKKTHESKRYCSYLKYESCGEGELNQSEIIFRILYEEWESDSILFVHYYNDTVLNNNLIFNERQLFKDLDVTRKQICSIFGN